MPEGEPYVWTNDPNPCLRAHHMPEGTPYVSTNDPNPSLRAYHKPEGTPYVFKNHPTPNIKVEKNRNKKKKHLQNDENKRTDEDRNKQGKEGKEHEIKYGRRELSAEQQGDLETSCPAAMRQRKSWVEMGDGSGTMSGMHSHTKRLEDTYYKRGMAN